MAEEPPPKRRRDDSCAGAGAGQDSDQETTKRQKYPYINNQQDSTQDLLLDFLTNLSSDPFLVFNPQPEPDPDSEKEKVLVEEDDDEKERVIRHLLEASDDELGIPSRVENDGAGDGAGAGDGGDDVAAGDMLLGLWEIEDEAANYYTLLQSELFMQ